MTTPELAIELEGQPTGKPEADAFVVFGATGDLAYKKIFPALHNMVRHGTLNIPVIGVAKSGWTIDQLRERARNTIVEFGGGVDDAAFARLLQLLQYIDGDYGSPGTFNNLRTLSTTRDARLTISPFHPGLRVKQPGPKMVPMPLELAAVDHAEGDEVDAHERLLTDAMRGHSLLFVREDAVEASWAVEQPVLGNVSPAHVYEPGSWGPAEADSLAADIGGWHDLK
jgi:glucose-6-phosphate 1-dehydrogenase